MKDGRQEVSIADKCTDQKGRILEMLDEFQTMWDVQIGRLDKVQ